jgi:hypothetical protein
MKPRGRFRFPLDEGRLRSQKRGRRDYGPRPLVIGATSAELLAAAKQSPDKAAEWEVAFHRAGVVIAESFAPRVVSRGRSTSVLRVTLAAGRLAEYIALGITIDIDDVIAGLTDNWMVCPGKRRTTKNYAPSSMACPSIARRSFWGAPTGRPRSSCTHWSDVVRLAFLLVERWRLNGDDLYELFPDD